MSSSVWSPGLLISRFRQQTIVAILFSYYGNIHRVSPTVYILPLGRSVCFIDQSEPAGLTKVPPYRRDNNEWMLLCPFWAVQTFQTETACTSHGRIPSIVPAIPVIQTNRLRRQITVYPTKPTLKGIASSDLVINSPKYTQPFYAPTTHD